MKRVLPFILMLILFSPVAQAKKQLVDRVVAVVNDEVITQSELDVFLRPIYEQLKENLQGAQLMTQLNDIRRKLLNQLIEDRLVFQEARRQGIEVRDLEVEDQIEAFKKQFPNEQLMEEALQKEGISLSVLQERLKRQAMIRRLHDVEVRAKVVVSPLEIQEYYQTHLHEFSSEPQLKVRSITIKKGLEARQKGLRDEKAETTIQELREQILSGEDFEQLAHQFSEDTRAREGGMGEWVEKGQMIPVIDDVIFQLPVGQVSKIIETPMGYHLFRVEERKEGKEPTLDQVREEIHAKLFKEKSVKRFEAWMEELKRDAYISIR